MSMLPQGTTRWLILALVGILNFGPLAPSLALAQVDHAIGSTATVTNSGDDPVLLRVAPNYDAEVLTVLPEGATVTVLNKPETAADGSIWIQVEADGESGYVVADFLLADTDESAVATEEATVSTELEPVPQTEPAEPVEPVEQAEQSERTEPTTEADPLVAVASTGGSGTATTTSNLNLRSGPSLNYAVITVIPADSTVSVDGDPQVGFYPVTYNGTGGWAHGDYLRFDSDNGNSGRTETGSGTAQVRVNLNLRAGPSTADAVIMVMPADATVTLTGQSANGFLSVSFNGRAGWAYADYLDTSGGSTPPPSSKPDGRTAMTTTNLNMRSGPSLSNSVILVIPAGSTVETTGNAQSGFYPVNYAGRSGWAHGDYLNFGSGSGNNPSPPPGGSGSGIISHKATTARATTIAAHTISITTRSIWRGLMAIPQAKRFVRRSTARSGGLILAPAARRSTLGMATPSPSFTRPSHPARERGNRSARVSISVRFPDREAPVSCTFPTFTLPSGKRLMVATGAESPFPSSARTRSPVKASQTSAVEIITAERCFIRRA